VGKVSAARALAERGLELVGAQRPGSRRLEEMRDLYAFMERELPALLTRWSAERNGLAATETPSAGIA